MRHTYKDGICEVLLGEQEIVDVLYVDVVLTREGYVEERQKMGKRGCEAMMYFYFTARNDTDTHILLESFFFQEISCCSKA